MEMNEYVEMMNEVTNKLNEEIDQMDEELLELFSIEDRYHKRVLACLNEKRKPFTKEVSSELDKFNDRIKEEIELTMSSIDRLYKERNELIQKFGDTISYLSPNQLC